ncbi:hypothetical protein A3C78_00955 [Candidatus Azambacteria bacterium RIFCSPHIGHO2_02_FULL_45_18]|uniref:Uncharacterized protein n=1 Tax=Candidatus Azambacteria bacterium RIFCSPLOWO2_02_FULL_44_14 TaxID=1797306 RepID=A0A1F5CCG3_9BACT|nr:MAG: hypothetical protein A3C78_00955 [Candidatus Azambacteria bacterium RIFCSPHIGHO2_02_FULL_45_18]OGD40537.1 MAG: hypothetical protein A3I30_01810 [Candidatus Azambacteria bacterium RIFCSPLOWO2_02_FULL_44_14]
MIARATKDIKSAQFMDGRTVSIKAGRIFEVCGTIYHDQFIYVHDNGGHLILPRNKVKILKNTKRSLEG